MMLTVGRPLYLETSVVMVSLVQIYTIILAFFELPAVVLLLVYDQSATEVTPWFDNVAPLGRRSYAFMYAAILVLMMFSRLLSVYLPRHRLLQVYNAILHTLELPLYFSLLLLMKNPVSPVCYIFLTFMVINCVLFSSQALKVLKLGTKISIHEEEKKKKM
ncbi:uncharacterized protein TM35_000371810 [Trypanosoma theileri]|uniref:Uncharacterized protein n=1 Tax=Trypanosoma theileri TaxID=67003 RepID=A0A1X0NL06_9TRYP|nr:uncharacterized protein TM35_000371810 [Trypanosoma theileri]ORC85208.1 hypothetical protein TM35_000371810 [Trypanosoma theileri]